MALQAAYKQFLAAPSSSALAKDASLHYITSTTSYTGPTDIIKHLGALRAQIKNKKETVLSAVGGQNAVAAEIETSLEFVSSGGPYVPGLDDNFLTDRSVSFLVIHFVTFDAEGRIAQIRQTWDQGSLLKQLDVMGKSGRNWPIRDGKDQLTLVARCVKPTGAAPTPAEAVNRTRTNSTNIMRDPHASLTLFASREEVENAPVSVVSPYAGNRPRQRSFTEILGDEPEEETSPARGRERSMSPSKAIAPKIGAGKNYPPIRLFDTDEEAKPDLPPKVGAGKNFQPSRLFDSEEGAQPDTPEKPASPDKYVKPDPRKYTHFEFADGSDPQDAPKPSADQGPKPKTKRDPNWSFEDFTTPQKPPPRMLHKARDVRHWGTEENDVVEESPERKQPVVKGRRDAEAHFEFVDDGPEPTEPRAAGRPRGSAHNNGLGLYENNLYNEDGSAPTPGPPPLGNITNLGGRRKDFETHFVVSDESPEPGNGVGADANAKIGDDRKKAVRMMESNWSTYDKSPAQKENNPLSTKGVDERGIAIGGDGMGGKKGTNRDWLFGDDIGKTVRNVPGKQQKGGNPDSFWDF
ncbi:hypothetical protein QBC47DRAFT_56632 [Echria macrotheca]|uniref:NTF2-like protein n=1 Tax=Echria macrotheca TaxID=438768 RepID=A0AAJ0B641_9PEZI|nr:hypothetical protein QBC47DRAFT_56632 [Echria macrotheca]